MFTMIFVNDLAGVSPTLIPWWMRHFKADGNGMTFVDLVFPAFLFLVGMSIPFALDSRLRRGEPIRRTLLHILARTASLLLIGVLMVNESPDATQMGWSPALWTLLMYGSALLAFCDFVPSKSKRGNCVATSRVKWIQRFLQASAFLTLAVLAWTFRASDGHRIIQLDPFSIHTEWYGILGLIGWAYLVAAGVFLVFRHHRTALLGSIVLLFCLYPADRAGLFRNFWLSHYVGIGETLGSQAAISVAGVLLASRIASGGSKNELLRFTLLFIAACAAAALLLHGLYGINKNSATPSWCLWACAITAAMWLTLHWTCDKETPDRISRSLVLAGGNVLLPYLLSEMLPSALDLLGLSAGYGRIGELGLGAAIARSGGCALLILAFSIQLNRSGFRLRL